MEEVQTMKNRLKELRKENGLTLDQISERTGIKRASYNNYENNKTEPKLATWEHLADALDVSPAYLVGWEDKKTKGNEATVYLKGGQTLTLKSLGVSDENWINGEGIFGERIHIPTNSVLYVEETVND